MLKAELFPYQDSAVDLVLDLGYGLVAYEMGLGKEQPISEPVLTPSGWVPIGEIRPGHQVIGKDGGATDVLGVFPQGVKPVYRVTFSDGSWTRAGWDHLWQVRTGSDLMRGVWRVLSTKEILESGLRDGARNRKYRVPMVDPVNYPDADLPIDPYVFGVLLGDGCIRNVVMLSSADPELVEEVVSRSPGIEARDAGGYDYRLVGTTYRVNPILNALRELGLMGADSYTKFIPEVYLRGSVAQREALLQGLLDTDGHVRPDNNVEYCTVSPFLAEAMRELVESLGGTCRVRTKPTTHQLAYRMSVRVPNTIKPFLLRRKATAYRPWSKYPPTRLIESIEPEGEEDSVCLLVAAKDHLYVTRRHVVTHNTMVGMAVAEELLAEPAINFAMIVVPSGLKYQWAESIARFTDVATKTKKIKRETITIPQDRHCVVVDGPPAKRAQQYAYIEEHWPNYVIISYEQVVNDWERVQGLQADLIILDEATAIKGFKAQRSKAVKALDPDFAVALTGTPLENRPEEVYSIMEFVCPGYLGSFESFDRKYIVRNGYGAVKRYRNLDVLHKKLAKVMSRKTRLDPDVAPYMPDVSHKEEYVFLNAKAQRLYKKISAQLVEELRSVQITGTFDLAAYYSGEGGQDMSAQGRIMAKVMALQMLCDHPALILDSALKYAKSEGEDGSEYAYTLVQSGALDGVEGSPKMDTVLADVRDLLESNPENKIIIFSFFKGMVRMFQEALSDYDSVIYTGDLSTSEKAAAKARFQQRPECRLFIASDAGGYGVDLPQANYLINYDLAESAGKMDQRNARHVRAGSKFDKVFVVNYLVEGSIEERTLARLRKKRSISSAIIDGASTDMVDIGVIEWDVDTLTEFLDGSSV